MHGVTHDAGGTLDLVCTSDDSPPPVVDVGLSDYRLLHWSSSSVLQPRSVSRKRWRSFDPDAFRVDLLASPLCD